MSKYSKYPSYKDSGVEWLGEIPEGWSSVSMKWISNIFSGGTPDKSNLKYWENGAVSWINSGEVNQFYITKPSAYITSDALMKSSAKWINKYSLVMALAGQGKTKGMVAQLGIRSTCNQSMAAIEPHKNYYSRFLLWWLSANYQRIRNISGGDLRDGLNLDLLGNISCPIFHLNEQKSIANYLDKATTKIDTLIEKQTKLIELLKEKRQAVISSAVTRGLDASVPMKESGVEWLGEIPEGWVCSALGYYSELNTGATPDRSNSHFWSGTIPWIKTGEVRYKDIYSAEEYITEKALNNSSVKLSPAGTVLMAMYGQGVTRGRVAILKVNATYNQACVAISPDNRLFNLYLKYFFIAAYSAIRDGGNETSQMNLNADIVKKIKVSIPNLLEQKAIVSYLDKKVIIFDSLITKSTQAINLLKEKRTALISAAVTGKIDVRDAA